MFLYRKTSLIIFSYYTVFNSPSDTDKRRNYTMIIGERIKKIRVFRKMTMDELGGALGFEGKNMSVRISQYEQVPASPMKI